MLKMTDESGRDSKILAVPIDKLSAIYSHVLSPEDLPQPLLASIAHFFKHYKDLEEGKWVEVDGWTGVEDAKDEIKKSIERYQSSI